VAVLPHPTIPDAVIGRRLPVFVYTGKDVVSHDKWEETMRREIDQEKKKQQQEPLDYPHQPQQHHLGGRQYQGDEGSWTCYCCQVVTALLSRLCQDASRALPGSPPQPTNHLDAVNPWESKYGEGWVKEINKVGDMKKIVSIRDLVMHMYNHTKQAYQGTKYENNFFFYHDALYLLRSGCPPVRRCFSRKAGSIGARVDNCSRRRVGCV